MRRRGKGEKADNGLIILDQVVWISVLPRLEDKENLCYDQPQT